MSGLHYSIMDNFALVTGASSGIGHELSKIFARNGYNLVLVSRTKEKLEAISKELENEYGIQAKLISINIELGFPRS